MFDCFAAIQQEEINRQLKINKRNESYYKRAEQLAHIGNWRWNIASDKLEWTDELYRIYEFGLEEEITFEKVAAYNHPDDKALVQDKIAQSLKSGEPFRILLSHCFAG